MGFIWGLDVCYELNRGIPLLDCTWKNRTTIYRDGEGRRSRLAVKSKVLLYTGLSQMPSRHPTGGVEKVIGYKIMEFSGEVWDESQ